MHPYTRGLLESIPRGRPERGRRLRAIEGMVPDLRKLAAGCRFAERCPLRIEKCTREEPGIDEVAPGRRSRCWRATEASPERGGDGARESGEAPT
jgi:peptide/nickel transport system ATP-binding protein